MLNANPRSEPRIGARNALQDPARALVVTTAIACVLTALAIALVDRPFAHFIATHETGEPVWSRVLGYVEYVIGIVPASWPYVGIAVLCAGVIVTRAVPRWRHQTPAWMFVALVHLLSRNATFWIKFATGRLRPTEWLAKPGSTFWRDDGWSFPSGHVTLVASLALPIAVVFPRMRPVMFALVVFVMAARVAASAHFIGDVVGGVALVCAVSWLCARWVAPLAQIRAARDAA